MNIWIQRSIELANNKNYLDKLFDVYPMIPNKIRKIDETYWDSIVQAFNNKDDICLIKYLLYLDLFPIKDSYIPFLRRDTANALKNNPETVKRLCNRLYEMGLDKIREKCTEPKETNRQIGPLFKKWCKNSFNETKILSVTDFEKTKEDAILDASDKEMMDWAFRTVNYKRNKGLDFVGRFNGKYLIGEAKFLSDFGGHQDAQLEDAILTLTTQNVKATKIAILDGVCWLKTNNKMYKAITEEHCEENIMSALLLKDFIKSL